MAKTKTRTVKKVAVDNTETNGANKPVEIQVSLDNLLIGDLETLEQAGQSNLGTTDMLDFLDRVVVGGNVRLLPMSQLSNIMTALTKAIGTAADPGN